MDLRACLVGVSILLASAHAAAQSETAVSIDEALARADERAPDVAVAAAQAAVARRDVDVAGILPNPRIGGGLSVDYAGVLDLYVLLPIFGQLDTATDAARARAEVGEIGIGVARLDARLAVALAWTDLWLAGESARLAEGDAERRDRLLEAAVARESEGSAARLDVLRTQADAARAHAEADALATARDAAGARLAGAIGGDPTTESLRAAGAPLGASVEVPALDAVDDVLATHPLAERARASVHAADEGVRHDHRSRWPRLGVQLSDWIHRSNEQHDVRLMLTMDLALFDEPRIARSEAARDQARAEDDATLVRLRAGVVAARADFLAARERCRAIEESVLPTAREAAVLARDGYAEGSLDLTATLAAAQAEADAERALATCTAERARAAARLDHAEGRTDDWR